MMKFGVYLEQAAVPEWREKYLDYEGLKALVKDMVRSVSVQQRSSSRPSLGPSQPVLLRSLLDPRLDVVFEIKEVALCPLEQSKSPCALVDTVPQDLDEGHQQKEIRFIKLLEAEIDKIRSFYNQKLESFSAARSRISLKLEQALSYSERREMRRLIRELFVGLQMLKSFHGLNYIAIAKLMSKHHQHSTWKELELLILNKMQDQDYFPTTKALDRLSWQVEQDFKLTCSPGLTPNIRDEILKSSRVLSHWITFTAALQLGIVLGALLSLCVLLLIVFKFYHEAWTMIFVDTEILNRSIAEIIPLYRPLFLIFLHWFLWGVCLSICEKRRISVRFIMNASIHSFLRWNQVLMVRLELEINLTYLVFFDSFILLHFRFLDPCHCSIHGEDRHQLQSFHTTSVFTCSLDYASFSSISNISFSDEVLLSRGLWKDCTCPSIQCQIRAFLLWRSVH